MNIINRKSIHLNFLLLSNQMAVVLLFIPHFVKARLASISNLQTINSQPYLYRMVLTQLLAQHLRCLEIGCGTTEGDSWFARRKRGPRDCRCSIEFVLNGQISMILMNFDNTYRCKSGKWWITSLTKSSVCYVTPFDCNLKGGKSLMTDNGQVESFGVSLSKFFWVTFDFYFFILHAVHDCS